MHTHSANIYFCSAFNDLSFILYEIEKSSFKNSVVYVINNDGAYNFLRQLNIPNIHLEILKSRRREYYKLYTWIKEWYYLNFTLLPEFKKIKKQKVYFYATYYDGISMFAAGRLRLNNSLVLGIHDNQTDFVPIKRRLFDMLLSLLYRVPITTYSSFGLKVSGLASEFKKKYFYAGVKISNTIIASIRAKYAYRLSIVKPFILILSSVEDVGATKIHENAQEIFLKIIEWCKSEVLVIKAHPRLGKAPFLAKYRMQEMPNYIPIEFLELANCRMVIGINSIALSNIANNGGKAISLINLLKFSSEDIRLQYIGYLNSNNPELSIIYPNNLEELKQIIKK